MSKEELRLKCLELAVKANDGGGTTWVIETAKRFERHVKEKVRGKST